MTSEDIIRSLENPKVKWAKRLSLRKVRKKEGVCLIEGPHLLEEALSAGIQVVSLFWTAQSTDPEVVRLVDAARSKGAHTLPVNDRVMASLSDTPSPQGLVAVAKMPSCLPEEVLGPPTAIVILEGIQDPKNAGSMLRSAHALGASGVILSRGTDPFGPKALRASMGSAFKIPVANADDLGACLSWLSSKGVRLVAADPHDGVPCHDADLTGPLALIMGSEGSGPSPEVASRVEGIVRVPMAGEAESLNVAASLAILLYERCLQVSMRD